MRLVWILFEPAISLWTPSSLLLTLASLWQHYLCSLKAAGSTRLCWCLSSRRCQVKGVWVILRLVAGAGHQGTWSPTQWYQNGLKTIKPTVLCEACTNGLANILQGPLTHVWKRPWPPAILCCCINDLFLSEKTGRSKTEPGLFVRGW